MPLIGKQISLSIGNPNNPTSPHNPTQPPVLVPLATQTKIIKLLLILVPSVYSPQ